MKFGSLVYPELVVAVTGTLYHHVCDGPEFSGVRLFGRVELEPKACKLMGE